MAGACRPFQSWPVWWIRPWPLRVRLFQWAIRFWLSSQLTIGQRQRMRRTLPSYGAWASTMASCWALGRTSTSVPGVSVVE